MHKDSTLLLLAIEGGTSIVITKARALVCQIVSQPECRVFLLEMLATFQLCACMNVLHPLVEVEPKPQLYLAHLYSFTAFHYFLTLHESISNPICALLYVLRKDISMSHGGLKIVAQFTGAFFARLYQNCLWVLGISSLLPDPSYCDNPLRTAFVKACCTELITSIAFQFMLLQSETHEQRVRANVLSLAITSLVYAGLLSFFVSFLLKKPLEGSCLDEAKMYYLSPFKADRLLLLCHANTVDRPPDCKMMRVD
uniref:Uncharacterized protein n=1 Tax=Salvator merianae TaxID=96440 RepID=A0A8D0BIQ9_SALMN